MKIHRYYLNTIPWWIIQGNLKPMDTNFILWRVGKALGVIK